MAYTPYKPPVLKQPVPNLDPWGRPPIATEGPNMVRPQQPRVPGTSLTSINPAQDLRSVQINPSLSRRQGTIDTQADTARNAVAGFSGYTPYQAPNTNDPYTQRADQNAADARGALGTVKTYGGYASINAPAGGSAGGSSYGTPASAPTLGYGADVGAARGLTSSALQSLNTAPNRGDIALSNYDLLEQRGQPQYETDLRDVGKRAASLGRVGAGMTTNDLGTVAQRRQEYLTNSRSQLANDAASQEMADRLARVSAGTNVATAFGGLDQAQNASAQNAAEFGLRAGSTAFNQDAQLRDEARGERDFNVGLDERNNSLGFDRASAYTDLGDVDFSRGSALRNEGRTDQDMTFDRERAGFDARRNVLGDLSTVSGLNLDREANDRNELRGERGYQTDASQRGIDNALRQRMSEEDLQNSAFDRNETYLGNRYKMGNDPNYDPTGLMLGESGRQQGFADQSGAGIQDLLEEYARSGGGGIGPAPQLPPVDYAGLNLPPIQPIPLSKRRPAFQGV